MITHASLLLLSSALFVHAAAAQTPTWPIVDGRQSQPRQQQIDTRQDDRARAWNHRVQPDIDRLYEELTRETSPQRR